jgi:single-strand DNA-binding protein
MNKVILMGRLGQDPATSYSSNGLMVTKISVATTNGFDKTTDWHRVTCFGKTAEIASKYLYKGAKVLLTGRISYRKWIKEGVTQYSTEIIADQLEFLDSKPKGELEQPSPTTPENYVDTPQEYTAQAFSEEAVPF